MRSAAAFITGREPELFTPPPIRPWDYLRLRREAAGLTIADAARRFWHRPEHQADVEANLRTFETPGHVVKDIAALDLVRAYPISIDTYRQLATLPADQHPRLCRVCGWDEWNPVTQLDRDDALVRWSETDPALCTGCEQEGW